MEPAKHSVTAAAKYRREPSNGDGKAARKAKYWRRQSTEESKVMATAKRKEKQSTGDGKAKRKAK